MSHDIEVKERKRYGKRFWIILGIVKVSIILLALLLFFVSKHSGTSSFTFKHIHGLGFNANSVLYMPIHDGLAEYKNGKWSKSDVEKNDYMGFSLVEDGFYSSGHPGTNSNLPDPLGIVKVTDGGKTVSKQALTGKADFHLMASGYFSQALYVMNPKPNDLMEHTGLYYSLDKGKSWTRAKAAGLQGKVTTMAVEPKKKNVIAIGTDKGLFYSDNFGKSFKEVYADKNVTALTYSFDNELLVATYDGKSSLHRLAPVSGSILPIELSSAEREPVIYIAQDPKDTNQLVIATKNNDIFGTENFGQNWIFLAKNGVGLSGQ